MSDITIYAGPNGSGKTTLRNILERRSLSEFINADKIQEEFLRNNGYYIFREDHKFEDWFDFEKQISKTYPSRILEDLSFINGNLCQAIYVESEPRNHSYAAAMIATYLRYRYLKIGHRFSFETCLSSKEKLDYIRKALSSGRKVCLNFVCTNNPDINVKRVEERVQRGGHNVPEEKIRERYFKSIENLESILGEVTSYHLYDNSEDKWFPEPRQICSRYGIKSDDNKDVTVSKQPAFWLPIEKIKEDYEQRKILY